LEQGQAWILSLCEPAQGHDLYISQATLVEVVATICRRAREQSISLTERDRLINVFRQDSKESYNIWPVTTDLYTSAGDLCRLHRLRAYDAVQLACVLALREYALANQVSELIFVCADICLLDFVVDDGIVPVFFGQHDALGGLWNGWQSQWREYKAFSLGTGYMRSGLHSTVSLSFVQIVNGMKTEHEVRYARGQLAKNDEKIRAVEWLRCPARKDKVVGHIGFGGVEVF